MVHNIAYLWARMGIREAATRLILERLPMSGQLTGLQSVAWILADAGEDDEALIVAEQAIAHVAESADPGPMPYQYASLVKQWDEHECLRPASRRSAELARRSMRELTQASSYANEHMASEAARCASLVMEALYIVGRTDDARTILTKLQECGLTPDVFGLAPVMSIKDSADAAVGLVDQYAANNRAQPLERAFAALVGVGDIGGASNVLARMDDKGDRSAAHLLLAQQAARRGAREQVVTAVAEARALIPLAPAHRRSELHTTAAGLLIDQDRTEDAAACFEAALGAVAAGSGGRSDSYGECAQLARRLGQAAAARHLLVQGWLADRHPMHLWELFLDLDQDAAMTLATLRWGDQGSR